MKNSIKKIIVALLILGIIFVVILVCSLTFEPVGDVVFSICFGGRYRKVDNIALKVNDVETTLSLYKARGKPFLILGPCLFAEDYYDFFFVDKEQVIRTAIDKGGDAWVRIGSLLFMLDDMTRPEDRLRSPYWDDIASDPDSSIVFDLEKEMYIYSFRIDRKTVPTTFTIPAKFFTSDMPNAKDFVSPE